MEPRYDACRSRLCRQTPDDFHTNVEARDVHLKSADFFDAASFPQLSFRSKLVTQKGSEVTIAGDLTIRGATQDR
ncbi:MAG: YceI family protein [Gemmatimonadetes bacterium]|nr:YceI family protein [Gemmatimonadota bacterium]